jgi:hypothetical protein
MRKWEKISAAHRSLTFLLVVDANFIFVCMTKIS